MLLRLVYLAAFKPPSLKSSSYIRSIYLSDFFLPLRPASLMSLFKKTPKTQNNSLHTSRGMQRLISLKMFMYNILFV